MNKKRRICLLLGAIFFINLMYSIYLTTYVEPQIVITTEICREGYEDHKPPVNVENYRRIKMHIKVSTPPGLINNVQLERDTSKIYLFLSQYYNDKNNDKIQFLGGGSSGDVCRGEYDYNMDIILVNMSDEELRNAIGNSTIKVSWKNLWNTNNNKTFLIKDCLK